MDKDRSDLKKVRSAKQKAAKVFGAFGPVVGVGITRSGGEYALKVNFEKLPPNPESLPTEIDGVPVVVDAVGKIRKQ